MRRNQAYFLRENLRLRLLNARVSLLARNETLLPRGPAGTAAWLNAISIRARSRRRDGRDPEAAGRERISFEMPDISESLAAVRGFKSLPEKRAR